MESYFGRPRNKKRFVDSMARRMGAGMGGMAAMFESVFSLEMMVSGYVEPLVNAEGAIELFRMLLRSGSITLDEVKRSNFGEAIQSASLEDDDDEKRREFRAAMAPNAVRQEQRYDTIKSGASQSGLGDLFSKVTDNTVAIVQSYKAARFELMSKRGFAYEPVSAKAVQAAFITCMDSGSLDFM